MIYFRSLLPHFLLLSAKWKALYIYYHIILICYFIDIQNKIINNMYWFPR